MKTNLLKMKDLFYYGDINKQLNELHSNSKA